MMDSSSSLPDDVPKSPEVNSRKLPKAPIPPPIPRDFEKRESLFKMMNIADERSNRWDTAR